ncbi:MAG: hypothetical protein K0Q92_1271 [Steroidobacteraceae bacterium]|nr:hypothetical protein [Steroidobacteraceae bacterium]
MVRAMKLFTCDNCQQTLYFENSRCVNCGETLGYCPDLARLATLRHPVDASAGIYEIERRQYRQCRNTHELDACNWLVDSDSDSDYCRSCSLSEVIPDLSDAANDAAWRRIEAAKRRLLYTLYALRLPVQTRLENPDRGLAFRFLKGSEDAPVMTGHDAGIITLNIDEADVAFRENMREKMGEGYRTVLGHLRHEVGHYYWDRLVADSNLLDTFRDQFGDERADYEKALDRHYGSGPPANWGESFISAYATMHPWEDFAETWAHYLHMVDTLETAKSHGLTVRTPAAEKAGERVVTERLAFVDFDALSNGWNAVTLALNSLNRSMGEKDAYPFVLTAPVMEKLRFVHRLIQAPVLSQVYAAA